MLRWICIVSIASAAVLALVMGCSQRPSSAHMPATQSAGQQVTIDNFAFDPQILTVSPGTTVTWLNRDDVPHTATSSDSARKFKSPALDTDEKFSHVFTDAGTYPYFCAVHPKMTGKIVVK